MQRAFLSSRSAMFAKCQARRCVRSFTGTPLRSSVSNGARCRAFFNFNKAKDTETVYTLKRDDFGREEVEDYFNYMGMLAAEGNYDRLEAMLASGEAAVDLLLLMACSEDDTPKVEELLAAGADPTRKDLNGKTPLELCTKEDIKNMLQAALAKRS